MISYGGVDLQIPSLDEATWIDGQIPPQDVFSFWHPRNISTIAPLNPRIHFAWWLQRPFKVNCYWCPWGASRWSYAFCLADENMLDDISNQNKLNPGYENGKELDFVIDDDLGNTITTPLFMLPPVPLSKFMNTTPRLSLWLLPLVDQRYFWWERAASIVVVEGVTTWSQLYGQIAAGLNVGFVPDPIASAYLKPSAAFTSKYDHLPPLLDWAATSCGQRIVRRLDDSIAAINSTTSLTLMMSQVNQNRKYAGGTIDLGIVDG